jgi:hypothetical protein
MRDYSQQVTLLPSDFGGEVLYAFDFLPENKRLNNEIYARAMERRRIRIQQSVLNPSQT